MLPELRRYSGKNFLILSCLNLINTIQASPDLYPKTQINNNNNNEHDEHTHTALLDANQAITDHDLDHLKENLSFGKPVNEMTRDERQFYYFKSADTDDDDHLDGLEILQTMIKFDQEDAEFHGKPFEHRSDEEWIRQLDKAMAAQDLNDDGKISFGEFYRIRNGGSK